MRREERESVKGGCAAVVSCWAAIILGAWQCSLGTPRARGWWELRTWTPESDAPESRHWPDTGLGGSAPSVGRLRGLGLVANGSSIASVARLAARMAVYINRQKKMADRMVLLAGPPATGKTARLASQEHRMMVIRCSRGSPCFPIHVASIESGVIIDVLRGTLA
jgi:hypothetical protein